MKPTTFSKGRNICIDGNALSLLIDGEPFVITLPTKDIARLKGYSTSQLEKFKVISLTDQMRRELPEHDQIIYEAHHALTGILNWHQSGKTKAAETYFLSIYQCSLAEQCLEMYWENRDKQKEAGR